MKFQRIDLIDRVKARIVAEEQRASDATAKDRAEFEQKRQDYLDSTAAGWTRLADVIRRRVRENRPISAADIPHSLANPNWSGRVKTFDATEPEAREPRTGELRQILAVLEACTDDEVTTTALERIGIKTNSIFRPA